MKGAYSTGKAGGAPQPAEIRQAEDSQYYTAAQFMEIYTDEAAQKWKEAAARATASPIGDEGDAPQLAADSHAVARRCICTLQDIANLTPEPNMGGKVAWHKPITTTGEEIITRAKVAENIFNLLSAAGKKQPFEFLTEGMRYKDINILRYGIIGGRDLRQLCVASRTVHEWVGIIGIEWNKQAKEPCITVWGTA